MWDAAFGTFVKRLFTKGSIEIEMPSGHRIVAGDGVSPPVRVRLSDPTLPRRIAMAPDMGVGEGYMEGTLTIENDDLRGFLDLALENASSKPPIWFQMPLQHVKRGLRWLDQWNPATRSQANVAHHYDLSGELYDLFLDEDKQYSCAYFRRPDDTLDRAQAQKKAHIAAKLLIEPGMSVLDIGCGWGGMAITLARDFGARVTGVTLSTEQHRVATERVQAAGLEGQVDIRLIDYRAVTGTFDRIVSVGMFEHVGAPQYNTYFRTVHDRLAAEGVALIHTIGRTAPPGITSPWISKYIFPGGYVPALSEMSAAIEHEHLHLTDVEVLRMHYAETLRHWDDRFTANVDRAREIYDDRFCRMWRFYLVASEMTFRYGPQVVFQAQLAHRKDAVPLTRGYLHETD